MLSANATVDLHAKVIFSNCLHIMRKSRSSQGSFNASELTPLDTKILRVKEIIRPLEVALAALCLQASCTNNLVA